jgi:hypothetical protein
MMSTCLLQGRSLPTDDGREPLPPRNTLTHGSIRNSVFHLAAAKTPRPLSCSSFLHAEEHGQWRFSTVPALDDSRTPCHSW